MSSASKRQIRVLVVDDDEVNLELMQTVLEAAGCEVLVARNASDGVDLARDSQPDVILMDIQLPELDGLEATRILKADPRTSPIPVIAVTAHVRLDDQERCEDAGCARHVSKPIDTRFLPDIVAKIVAEAGKESTT